MHKKLIVYFLSFISYFSLLVANDTLIVGTNAEFPPFTFIEKGQIVGFDIDIAKEVCERLGKKNSLKDMPFDALIPELALGRVNFAAAGMTITEERAKRVLFTRPYVTGDPLVIVTLDKGKIASVDDLSGKTVAVNEGYTADLFLSSKEGISLIRLNCPADGFLALKAGRVDAFVTANSTLQSFLKEQSDKKLACFQIEGTQENCALVISKKYPDLLIHIQEALDSMTKDGTIDKLKRKWGLS